MLHITVLLRIWLQSDNAVKEVRNSYTGRWATLMCQGGWFGGASHHHMVVGHTHEDIGQGKIYAYDKHGRGYVVNMVNSKFVAATT